VAARPTRPPPSSNTQAQQRAAINDAISELAKIGGGAEKLQQQFPPGTTFVAKSDSGPSRVTDTVPAGSIPPHADRAPVCNELGSVAREAGKSQARVDIPGWKPTEPYNHSPDPVTVTVVSNGKLVALTIPGTATGKKFGLWADRNGDRCVREWNNNPIPAHIGPVDANLCASAYSVPGAWKGWVEPRCEPNFQREQLASIAARERRNWLTESECRTRGGQPFDLNDPKDETIPEGECSGARTLLPFGINSVSDDIKEKRWGGKWCPDTAVCVDGTKRYKIVAPNPKRCRMRSDSRSRQDHCKPIRD
jgi:hypothetical protein